MPKGCSNGAAETKWSRVLGGVHPITKPWTPVCAACLALNHAPSLMLTRDVGVAGSLVFYDMGMVSTIVPATKERLLDVFYGVYRKDAKQVIDALQALGIIQSKGNDLALQNLVAFALENLTKQVRLGWL